MPKKTLEELADLYGCSREQIRWRESRALKAAGEAIARRTRGDHGTASTTSSTRRLVF